MTQPEEPATTEIVRSPATAAVIGLVSGAISAFFGIGSGLVMAPALVLLLRSRPARATGTALAVVLPIAAAALAQYQVTAAAHASDARIVLQPPVLLGAVLLLALGNVLGAGLLRARATGGWRYLFGALLVVAGALVWIRPFTVAPVGVYTVSGPAVISLLAVGCAAGAVTAFLGAGGGVILVPALVLALGFPQHAAEATSLGVILVATLFGALAHAARGNVIWSLVPWLSGGGILAGWFAMHGALLLPEPVLRAVFGVLLAIVGAGMILSRARRQQARLHEE